MKVALVHDWLTGMRGGERVLMEFLEIYPEADIFTLIHVPESTHPEIDAHVKQASWISSLPSISKWYRHLLPFYPLAARSLQLTDYDLVISLSHAAAKNVSVRRGTRHLCYCFTPMRYIWDQAEAYFGWKQYPLMPLIGLLRLWDMVGAKSVTRFASISRFITARIRCFYHRESTVIFPPVRTNWIQKLETYTPGEAFLYAGALVPYKKPDAVVEAFNRTGLPLWVVGDGPMLEELQAMAKKNIKFLGAIPDAELGNLYHRCRALIFPGIEDFGMIPVECMASGRPIIGLGKGGVSESVSGLKHWRNEIFDPAKHTGVFIKPNGINLIDSILSALRIFETIENQFDPVICNTRARMFSPESFQEKWRVFEQQTA